MQSVLCEMPCAVEAEEVFFDTKDLFVTDEPVVVEGVLNCSNFEYDMWLRKQESVKERREHFLRGMGFVEFSTDSGFDTTKRVAESVEALSCEFAGATVDENLLCERRLSNSEANSSADCSYQVRLDDIRTHGDRDIHGNGEKAEACREECLNVEMNNQKFTRLWRFLAERIKKQRLEASFNSSPGKMTLMKTESSKKRCLECSAVYSMQQINAHDGLIWTMKFSPDGRYLASGGKDGFVCIWRVSTCKTVECSSGERGLDGGASHRRKSRGRVSKAIPEKIFHIEEQPLHKFKAHASNVLDLAWSTSNHLLSASTDKTVCLWQVGSDKCLAVFNHLNYVTCIQFNPVDENYFISGSIDGKLRVWSIAKKRVVDWANVQDLVTAVCYNPNGKGFVAGCLSGICRFFETSGKELVLKAAINFQGKKKSGRKVTGIQYLKNDFRRLMITSEDSRVRILDGLDVVRKYRGRAKSGSQMSASMTSDSRHIVSVGGDSRVYVWNYDDPFFQTSKRAKSIRSCEHFLIEGISVAIPWTDSDSEWSSSSTGSSSCSSTISSYNNLDSSSRSWDSDHFSLTNWFLPTDQISSSRNSPTWAEEKLPLPVWDFPSSESDQCQSCDEYDDYFGHKTSPRMEWATWGLVFVTAGQDGTIRTFHNYGFPVRT